VIKSFTAYGEILELPILLLLAYKCSYLPELDIIMKYAIIPGWS